MKTQPMIEFAVKNCLSDCARTDFPMITVSDYTATLEQQGWDEQSIAEFRDAVITALTKPAEAQ